MTGLSTIKEEQIVTSPDKLTAIRYKVVEEKIDLESLRQERDVLLEQLAVKEPSKEELIELGKGSHPFYWDKTQVQKRLDKINLILGDN